MKMLAGLMSRWMMPAVCAASSASAIWMPEVEHRVQAQWTGGEAILQRRALQILHDDERPTVLLADVVDGADVRVVQRRGRLRFAREPAQGLGIASTSSSETNLSATGRLQPRIFGFVDDAHAAAAELLDDAVVRERLTNQWIAAGLTAVVAALSGELACGEIDRRSGEEPSARSCAASSERSSPSSCASPPQARWRNTSRSAAGSSSADCSSLST